MDLLLSLFEDEPPINIGVIPLMTQYKKIPIKINLSELTKISFIEIMSCLAYVFITTAITFQ